MLIIKKKMNQVINNIIEECDMISTNNQLGKHIGRGGNGTIYEVISEPDSVIKVSRHYMNSDQRLQEQNCINGDGCINEILMEGLIMQVLSTLDCDHFVKFKSLCMDIKENRYLLKLQKLNSAFTFTQIQSVLTQYQLLSILFQLTYALWLANTKVNFVHSDLIGSNIMIQFVPETIYHYKIDELELSIENYGVHATIFDFGYSRIKIDDTAVVSTSTLPDYLKKQIIIKRDYIPDNYTLDNMFDGMIDICKIYNNPNFKTKLINFYQEVPGLIDCLNLCKTKLPYFAVIPPLPKCINSKSILLSNLFDSIKKS